MAKPLTTDERQQIEQLLAEGKSYREIAETVGRSHGTIGKIARTIGHHSGQTNLARAHEARSAYCAERRAVLAARFTEECERLLDELRAPYVAFNFGGKDNTYAEHELAEPDVQAKRLLIQAAREAMRTVLDIDRHDNRAEEGAAAVDDWLRSMIGEASQ
jgi:DNA-binding CsgD family transcriptional regulator